MKPYFKHYCDECRHLSSFVVGAKSEPEDWYWCKQFKTFTMRYGDHLNDYISQPEAVVRDAHLLSNKNLIVARGFLAILEANDLRHTGGQ